MRVLLVNIDSKIPNLALMRLATWHRTNGDKVFLNSCPCVPDRVYASSVFDSSNKRRNQVRQLWPSVNEGGTGYGNNATLDDILGTDTERIVPDYSFWPEYEPSIGFTARGCRFACKFCVVPQKEGKPTTVHSVVELDVACREHVG